jgi:CRISPR-associated protein Cmr4
MERRPYLVHALSPLHAGTGQAVDIVDLPIARMESTRIPVVPGSSIKGVLREDGRLRVKAGTLEEALHRAVFGPEAGPGAAEHAGALVAADARLLALPVRTFKGVFFWVTSPLLLTLARRDLCTLDIAPPDVPSIEDRTARVADERYLHGQKLYLADLDLAAQQDAAAQAWAGFLAAQVTPAQRELLTSRFAVVDDDTMAFLWDTGTQIDARVSIDGATRTVRDGALWYEESLPPETLLVGLLLASPSFKREHTASAAEILGAALAGETEMQFGGKASVGRGRCRLLPLGGAR